MDSIGLVEKWIAWYALENNYTGVLHALSSRDHGPGLHTLGIPASAASSCCLLQIIQDGQYESAIRIITAMYRGLGDKLDAALVARVVSALSIMAMFYYLDKAKTVDCVRKIDLLFPRARLSVDLPTATGEVRERATTCQGNFRTFFLTLAANRNKEYYQEYMTGPYHQEFGQGFVQKVHELVTRLLRNVKQCFPKTPINQILENDDGSSQFINKLSGIGLPSVQILLDKALGKKCLSQQDCLQVLQALRPKPGTGLRLSQIPFTLQHSGAVSHGRQIAWFSSQSVEEIIDDDSSANEEHHNDIGNTSSDLMPPPSFTDVRSKKITTRLVESEETPPPKRRCVSGDVREKRPGDSSSGECSDIPVTETTSKACHTSIGQTEENIVADSSSSEEHHTNIGNTSSDLMPPPSSADVSSKKITTRLVESEETPPAKRRCVSGDVREKLAGDAFLVECTEAPVTETTSNTCHTSIGQTEENIVADSSSSEEHHTNIGNTSSDLMPPPSSADVSSKKSTTRLVESEETPPAKSRHVSGDVREKRPGDSSSVECSDVSVTETTSNTCHTSIGGTEESIIPQTLSNPTKRRKCKNHLFRGLRKKRKPKKMPVPRSQPDSSLHHSNSLDSSELSQDSFISEQLGTTSTKDAADDKAVTAVPSSVPKEASMKEKILSPPNMLAKEIALSSPEKSTSGQKLIAQKIRKPQKTENDATKQILNIPQISTVKSFTPEPPESCMASSTTPVEELSETQLSVVQKTQTTATKTAQISSAGQCTQVLDKCCEVSLPRSTNGLTKNQVITLARDWCGLPIITVTASDSPSMTGSDSGSGSYCHCSQDGCRATGRSSPSLQVQSVSSSQDSNRSNQFGPDPNLFPDSMDADVPQCSGTGTDRDSDNGSSSLSIISSSSIGENTENIIIPSSHSMDKFDVILPELMSKWKPLLPPLSQHLRPASIRPCIIMLHRDKNLEAKMNVGKIFR